MARHAATASSSARLWGEIEFAIRGFRKFFATPTSVEAGLETLEHEQARIRLTGRHWLAG